MSVDYSVDFETSLTPDELQRVLDAVPLPASTGIWRSNATSISARAREAWEETYGLRPTVGLLYQLDKFADDPGRQERDVLANVAALWALVPGDAFVTYSDGLPVLRRTDSQVVASADWVGGQDRRLSIMDDVLSDCFTTWTPAGGSSRA